MTCRYTISALLLALMLSSVRGFLSSPIQKVKARQGGEMTTLWGRGRIERVGPPSEDGADYTPPMQDDDEEDSEPAISIPSLSMEELLSPSPSCDVKQMGPTSLAYIGDVVFELFVRSRMVWPTRRTSDLQQQVVSLVRAEHQSKLLAALTENFSLTQAEEQILVRGRNSGSVKGNRRKTPAYNDATALEALVGYVYITDKSRCTELLNWMYAYLLELQ